ncbi:MAG: acyl-CoA thioester hydrolase/BAAT C-terminal domain-containing protein [Steroidobacteraceae bacterium]
MSIADRSAVFAVLLACFVGGEPSLAANITVIPQRGLVDEPLSVRIDGAPAGARVRVEAALTDDAGEVWTASGEYLANSSGSVNTAADVSVAGTYEGVLPGGLSCSALPVPRNELAGYVERLRDKPGRTTPELGTKESFKVRITVSAAGQSLGPVEIVREYLSAGVSTIKVSEGRLQGLYFQPAAGARGIPVVVLGGSGGGLPRANAMLLASRGHPALALAYFGYQDLPRDLVDIPLEGFADAAAWLKKRTGASGVVLMGTSRGSEAVMLTAAYLSANISGVIAIVPSPLVHAAFGRTVTRPGEPAWTLGGRGIPPVQSKADAVGEDAARLAREDRQRSSKGPPGYAGAPYFLANWKDPVAHLLYGIPVERIDVPLLLLGGDADTMWPSALGVAQIRDRMAAHGKAALVEAHVYPGAGHGLSRIGIGNEMSGFSVHPVAGTWVSTGGEPDANCRATYQVWTEIFEFLQRQSAAK